MIVVIPEAPYPFSVGKDIGFSWTAMANVKEDLGKDSMLLDSENIRNIIEYMKDKYNITKVYLLGFSQGAGLSYIAGIKNYDIIDGIAPFGGWFDEEYITRAHLKFAKENLDIFIAHGINDNVIPLESAEGAFNNLTEKGYNVHLEKFEGAHQVPANAQKAALEWLKDQNK